MASRTLAPIDFYGEARGWARDMQVHCEQLAVRSAQHNWRIEAHRHHTLTQIFVVSSGAATAQLDDRRVSLDSASCLIIPAMCVHGFRWQEGSTGYVLSIAAVNGHLRGVDGTALELTMDTPAHLHLGEDALHSVEHVCHQLLREQSEARVHGSLMRALLLSQLMIMLARLAPGVSTRKADKGERRVDGFVKLVRQHCTAQHRLNWYADTLGVSAAHLNQLCRRYRALGAQRILHDALVEEAKRNLLFADLSVSAIAARLGFRDPAYFNRFFKRMVGVTPRQFRQHSTYPAGRDVTP